jgi:hypothetical protein
MNCEFVCIDEKNEVLLNKLLSNAKNNIINIDIIT